MRAARKPIRTAPSRGSPQLASVCPPPRLRRPVRRAARAGPGPQRPAGRRGARGGRGAAWTPRVRLPAPIRNKLLQPRNPRLRRRKTQRTATTRAGRDRAGPARRRGAGGAGGAGDHAGVAPPRAPPRTWAHDGTGSRGAGLCPLLAEPGGVVGSADQSGAARAVTCPAARGWWVAGPEKRRVPGRRRRCSRRHGGRAEGGPAAVRPRCRPRAARLPRGPGVHAGHAAGPGLRRLPGRPERRAGPGLRSPARRRGLDARGP